MKHLSTNGSVVNMCRTMCVRVITKAQLKGSIGSPTIRTTLVIDENAVRGTRSNTGHGADVRDHSRSNDIPRFLILVEDKGIAGNSGDVETSPSTIDAAPDEGLTIVGKGEGIMLAASHLSKGF